MTYDKYRYRFLTGKVTVTLVVKKYGFITRDTAVTTFILSGNQLYGNVSWFVFERVQTTVDKSYLNEPYRLITLYVFELQVSKHLCE